MNNKIFLIISFLICVALHADDAKSLDKVTLMTHWLPQAQFAGYYAAKDFGIYKKYGLDVTIKNADPFNSASELIKQGKADFITLFLSSAIKLRANGLKLINIAQTSQGSALLFVARKSSGIQKPEDINGRKIGLWMSDFQEIPQAFLKQYKINAKIVPIASGINLFLWNGIDLVTVMHYNEFNTIINSGIDNDELTTFYFSDHNLDIPEDGIYCMEAFYRKNPDICRRFVLASMEGWRYALEHENDVLSKLSGRMKELHLAYNKFHQQWMLKKVGTDIFRKGKSPGALSEAQYLKCSEVLLKDGIIKKVPGYTEFHINPGGEKNADK